jgi:hypothetical protein
MTIVLPDPLPDARAYLAEIQRLDQEIAEASKQLSRLRRERGCRLMQLEELEPGHDLLKRDL